MPSSRHPPRPSWTCAPSPRLRRALLLSASLVALALPGPIDAQQISCEDTETIGGNGTDDVTLQRTCQVSISAPPGGNATYTRTDAYDSVDTDLAFGSVTTQDGTANVTPTGSNTFQVAYEHAVPADAAVDSMFADSVSITYVDLEELGFDVSALDNVQILVTAPQSSTGERLIEAALTPNQIALANAVNTVTTTGAPTGSLSAAFDELASQPVESRRIGLDGLSYEEIEGHRALGLQGAAAQLRNIAGRIAALRVGVAGLDLDGLTVIADGRSVQGSALVPDGGGASADGGFGLGGLGVFVNGAVEIGGQDRTGRRDGSDFTTLGLTVGADYRIGDQAVVGAAFGFSDADVDFDRGGGMDVRSYSGQVFGLFYPMENLSIDAAVGHAWIDYKLQRRAELPGVMDVTARSSTDGRQLFGTVGVMYDVPVQAATISPFGRLEAARLKVDGFTEAGADPLGLVVESQRAHSLTSALGVQASYAISTEAGIVQPQARIAWMHEFRNSAREVGAHFQQDLASTRFSITTDKPDRDWLDIGAGVSLTTVQGFTAFVDYEGSFARSDLDRHRFTGGVRMQF
jgi:uncharacterized protein with beta-barrel porin domain